MKRYFNINQLGGAAQAQPHENRRIVTCDSCQLARINGVICHEIGCRSSGKTWEGGAWVRFLNCHECGCEVREGDICDCQRWDEESVC
jgi:hypothetical protein